MRVRYSRFLAAAGIMTTLAGATSGQAGAQVVVPVATPAPQARNCVVWISPLGASGQSRTSPMRCYSTWDRARTIARGRPPAAFLRSAPDVGQVATASTLISTDYGQGSFSGDTLTWTVPNSSGCNGGNAYQAASMPSGWNDRVSSSKSAGGCAENDHFQNTNFLGAGITCTCSTMGSLNNATSSETWNQ